MPTGRTTTDTFTVPLRPRRAGADGAAARPERRRHAGPRPPAPSATSAAAPTSRWSTPSAWAARSPTALLSGDVGAAYRRAMERAESHGHGTRMTLSLADAPALLSVPWEFLYQRPRFLASQRRTPIVRLLETGSMAAGAGHRRRGADPRHRRQPRDLAPLDVAGERRRITQALAPVVGRRAGRARLARTGVAEEPAARPSRRQLPRHPLRRPQRLHRPTGPASSSSRIPTTARRSRSTRRCSPTCCRTRTRCGSSCSTRARAPGRR